MEGGASEEGACPKKAQDGRDLQDFDAFLIDVKNVLLKDEIQMLATALDFTPAERDKVERSEDPGHVFVHLLKRKGIISRTDISALTEKLKFCGLCGLADDVNGFFSRYQFEAKLQPTETPEYRRKKNQFVTELKNKYTNLCGEIQPVPFLREKYDVEKLFVEGGIKFLDEEQRSSDKNETWTRLRKYKMVFTDPRIKSKRRIIDGGPGYGKSTLALQITNDWCRGLEPMTEFEIVILLRLRQLKNAPTIYSAIKRFLLPKDSKLTEDDIEIILDSSLTLILLDGYDEYPDKENGDTDIQHIIRGDMFLKHEVVLTTRTSCLPPKYSKDTKRIRLTGFDEASRDSYIANVVARGCPDDATKISHFFKVNPVPADLCKIPLFFAMITYIIKKSERFRNFSNVTQFFRHVIKCFHSHREIKLTEGNQEEELDHSKLDKVAFEGLSDKVQQVSWEKNKLIDEIGKNLYERYVNIGILIEEDGFDYDSLEYHTETHFLHKLFAEWYGAHYVATVAAQPETELEPWPKTEFESFIDISNQSTGPLQPEQATPRENVHSLKSVAPFDVHYMYRFACGLNPVAAQKIIKLTGKNRHYDRYTMLCITEWGGSLEAITDTITSLCSREIHIGCRDSSLLQKSTIELLQFASSRKIPVYSVSLWDCLINVGSVGKLCVTPCNLPLPVFDCTLHNLVIFETGREITETECDNIFRYSTICRGLKQLQFSRCLPPRYIKVTESLSVLRSRNVQVKWWSGSGYFNLNFESNHWENVFRGIPLTDELEYQKAEEDVRGWAKERKQLVGKY